jgi:DNA-directed RNA polymerase specialized sigma24 family protein
MLDSGLVNRSSQPTRQSDGSRIILDDLPSPKQRWVLNPESFDGLLLWLDHDRERAGERYESIRSRLIKRFRRLGCSEAEELANQTMDRVAKKLPKIVANYVGEREPYFFATAYNVYREYLRKPVVMSLTNVDFAHPTLSSAQEVFEKELLDFCLRHCIEKLHPNSREMIREYYGGEKQHKIRLRKQMAERFGIKLANLRLRAQRVRTDLKKCILDCMERKAMERETLM